MMRKTLAAFLMMSFMMTTLMAAPRGQRQADSNASVAQAAAPTEPQEASAQGETAQQSAQPQSATRRRSYDIETGREHRKISKKEVAFMAAIAGTSMGIGALAGGAKGLAIGSIVGGWGAYVGHRLWKRLK